MVKGISYPFRYHGHCGSDLLNVLQILNALASNKAAARLKKTMYHLIVQTFVDLKGCKDRLDMFQRLFCMD
ncbi:MAG: hypothetical protein EAX87_09855 [Candidatus Thorarchaeota archaeon]|nr:hypothetical protein [Candidatus Thorarchaeota archaeon]